MKRNLTGAEAQNLIISTPPKKGDFSTLGINLTIDGEIRKTPFFDVFAPEKDDLKPKVVNTRFECNPSGDLATILINTNINIMPKHVIEGAYDKFLKTDPVISGADLYFSLAVIIDHRRHRGTISLGYSRAHNDVIHLLPGLPTKHFSKTYESVSKAAKEMFDIVLDSSEKYAYAIHEHFHQLGSFPLGFSDTSKLLGELVMDGVLDSRQTTELSSQIVKLTEAMIDYKPSLFALEVFEEAARVLESESPLKRIKNLQRLSEISFGCVCTNEEFFFETLGLKDLESFAPYSRIKERYNLSKDSGADASEEAGPKKVSLTNTSVSVMLETATDL